MNRYDIKLFFNEYEFKGWNKVRMMEDSKFDRSTQTIKIIDTDDSS